MHRRGPLIAIIALAAISIALLGALINQWMSNAKAPDPSVRTASAKGTSDRCASQRTYDRIKVELFRRAAETRGGDQGPFDRLASYSSVRVERPLLTSLDKDLGTQRCSGQLSLDLPPGVAVVGGRRSLTAQIDYVLQPAADGSGDVVMLEGADPIVVPLATLSRSGSEALAQQVPQPPVEQTPDSTPAVDGRPQEVEVASREPAAPPEVKPAPRSAASARPSFNCRYARTGSEVAVCNDGDLAALDRQMSAQYYRALASSDARQRRLLGATRDQFLRARDRCGTKACIADTYRGRMRQIRDIVESGTRF